MTKYTATFGNGARISRKSARSYTFAWAVFDAEDKIAGGGHGGTKGFSASRVWAVSAAADAMRRWPTKAVRAEVVQTNFS